MTQFTSFVAVEEMTITDGGVPRRVEVPVELPEGVSREGVFGAEFGRNISTGQFSNFPTQRTVQSLNAISASVVVVTRSGAANPSASRTKEKSTVNGQKSTSNNMVIDGASSVDITSSTPGEIEKQKLTARLHPAIAKLLTRLKDKKATPELDESKFVRDGKAEIQIWLTDKSPQVLEELKKLGFEVVLDPQSAKMVIGRIALDKLAALGEVKAVRYISPQAKN
jgi:Ca-activated chloride channel family protein